MSVMRIYPINQAKLVPEDLVFRQSRLWAALGMALCGSLLGVGIYLSASLSPFRFGNRVEQSLPYGRGIDVQ